MGMAATIYNQLLSTETTAKSYENSNLMLMKRTVENMQSLYNTIFGYLGMECVITIPCYKGTILQWNYRKMTISFPCNSFVKFHGKKVRSYNMTIVVSKSML